MPLRRWETIYRQLSAARLCAAGVVIEPPLVVGRCIRSGVRAAAQHSLCVWHIS